MRNLHPKKGSFLCGCFISLSVLRCASRKSLQGIGDLVMSALKVEKFQPTYTTLSVEEIRERLTENERMQDAYLSRITRLQMLLQLEETRLLEAQSESRELRIMLDATAEVAA